MHEILDNKYLFHLFMSKNGFGEYAPILYQSKISGKKNNYHKLIYPCICKPLSFRGGGGIYIINSDSDIRDEARDEIIEEFIFGTTEYVGHFSVKSGSIKHSIYFKTTYDELNIKCGDMKDYTVVEIDNVIFNHIFTSLNYSGFACANFKIVKGSIKIFEINPRLGGSVFNNEIYLKEII